MLVAILLQFDDSSSPDDMLLSCWSGMVVRCVRRDCRQQDCIRSFTPP